MSFIGREEEQKAIHYLLSQDGFQGAIIYGRRRLGKTELLKHCLLNQNVPCIFYQCSQESEESNVSDLTKAIEEALSLSHLHFDSFVDAVAFVFEKAIERKLYFVIDEYPYIRKISPSIDSKLQRVIDQYRHSTHVCFFLCGSSVSTMEGLLSEGNPLYRRFALSILLKEMDYYDSSLFYPTFSLADKVRLFAAFGGSPFYNSQINESLSVTENIILLLSGRFAAVADDITVNLKNEIVKINNANAVFASIAEKRAFHYSDILAESHLPSSSILSDVLEKLLSMDLIEYVCPINDKNNKTKSGYQIKDNAMRFFYRYIFRNQSERALLSEEMFFRDFIQNDFESEFVPKAFETVAKQYLIRRNKRGENKPLLLDIGTYWYDSPKKRKNGQFDVVGKTKDGYVFYEVKFTKEPITNNVIQNEIEQVKETTLTPVQYGFVSLSGFDLRGVVPYILITIEDIYQG